MQTVIKKSISYIFIILITLSIIGVFVTHALGLYIYNYKLPQILMLVIGPILILLVSHLINKCNLLNNTKFSRKIAIIFILISFIHFLFLVFLSHNSYFIAGWDCNHITRAASNIATNCTDADDLDYLSIHPNNLFISLLYSWIIRGFHLVGYFNDYFACILFQCFVFATTGYLVFRTTQIISNATTAIISYIIYIALVGLSPWVNVPYSDGSGLVFPILFLYLYVRIINTTKKINSSIYVGVLSLLIYPAYKLKPQTIILVIAIIIISLIDFDAKSIKKALSVILISITAFAIGFILVQGMISSSKINLDLEKSKSIWYYICTGANEEYIGVCNPDDQAIALSYDTLSERNSALIKQYCEHMKSNGFTGTLLLAFKKNTINHFDGSFGWWGEGSFMIMGIWSDNMTFRNFFTNIYYPNGSLYPYYRIYCQCIWFGVLALCPLAIIKSSKNKLVLTIALSIIGLIIFEIIFECRARYMFTYVPLYIILCSIGVCKKIPTA